MARYRPKKVYSWDGNIAYFAGLIASDGCMYKDGRHINLTSNDSEIIIAAMDILNLKVRVRKKASPYSSVSYDLTFSDVALYDFLYCAGIKPSKSKTIQQVSVPDRFYACFLRGYFDGDGSVYGYWDNRWKNSLMYYTEFCSASTEFLFWLKNRNSRLFGTTDGRIKPGVRAQALSYAKADSQILFKHMYRDQSVPRLKRKYVKFIDFLETDPYAKHTSASAGIW